jgi:hypothetical protein
MVKKEENHQFPISISMKTCCILLGRYCTISLFLASTELKSRTVFCANEIHRPKKIICILVHIQAKGHEYPCATCCCHTVDTCLCSLGELAYCIIINLHSKAYILWALYRYIMQVGLYHPALMLDVMRL